MRFLVLHEQQQSELGEALAARMRSASLEVATGKSSTDVGAAVVLVNCAVPDVGRSIARKVSANNHRLAHILVAGLSPESDGCRLVPAMSAAGASDVLLCADREQLLAEIVARLKRIDEVGAILHSRWVRERAVGTSKVWQSALEKAVEVAQLSDAACVFTGESGTGKDLLARLVHDLDPRRNKGPFIVVDCTTLRPELSGSELFGHVKGAFTNAISAREGAVSLANAGTLFLDEIGELDTLLQAQLLRVIQEHAYKRVGEDAWRSSDFRLLCATNRDLGEDVREGRFRRDLYYRVTQWQIHLPPLRERRTDVPLLAQHFLRHASRDEQPPEIAPEVLEVLATLEYPGNVRQLRNVVMRMRDRQRGFRRLSIGALPEEMRGQATVIAAGWQSTIHDGVEGALSSGFGLNAIRELTVRMAYEIALERAQGSAHQAALMLKVSRRAVEQSRPIDRRRNTAA